ncbi:MAG TPA: patatin-like phospholipase family protein [Actinomycetota bacterium]|nr:patatin-like phospholipase family protein [Actinomycetota bacterium]
MGNNPRAQPSRSQWLRRLASRRRNRVAFVLSGGGPLGALQVGALHALFERDIRPDLAVGTSVGALNATWLAMNPTSAGVAHLESSWRNMKEGDLFPGGRFRASWARMLVKGNKVFENSGLRRTIERTLGPATFEEAQIPLAVTATDLETGAEMLFSTGPVLEPLLASTAMPGIFPPVEVDGRLYIDGGVANNVPIAPAAGLGANTIYVMNSTSHSRQRRPLNRPMDYLLHAFTLARAQRLTLEQMYFADKVRLVMLPTVTLDFFVPFASMEHTATLIEMAYEQTARFLDGRTDIVETTSTDGTVETITSRP